MSESLSKENYESDGDVRKTDVSKRQKKPQREFVVLLLPGSARFPFRECLFFVFRQNALPLSVLCKHGKQRVCTLHDRRSVGLFTTTDKNVCLSVLRSSPTFSGL
jgi:hypothetical protein